MANKRPLIVAIIFGIIAVILVYAYMRSMEKELAQRDVQYGTVVVATDKIPVRMKIKEGMIREDKRPIEYIPQNAYTELDEVLGKVSSENIYSGVPLFPDQFKDVVEIEELAFHLNAEERAVTIGVTEIKAVGGNVNAGDHVDILASFKGGEEVGAPTTITILRDVRVVAVGRDIGTDIEETGGAGVSKTLTLAVAPEEAEILTLVDENANVRLSLRPPEEKYAPPSLGVTIADIVRYRPTRSELKAEAEAAEEERRRREEDLRRAWEAHGWQPTEEVEENGEITLPPFPFEVDTGPKQVTVEVITGGEVEKVTVPESLYSGLYSATPRIRYNIMPGMYPVPYFEE